MDTLAQLYKEVREKFPDITAKTDREHLRYWGDFAPEDEYSWFHSLANALNSEMRRQVSYSVHEPLFLFLSDVLRGCSEEVFKCIDVSFVENLFWQVSPDKAEPYWLPMPARLKELYIVFHSKPHSNKSFQRTSSPLRCLLAAELHR